MTHTNLDLLRESRIDDHWNVDVDRNLEGHIIKFKTSKSYLRSMEPNFNCDLILRPTCRKQPRKRKSMNGLLKNGRSTIREDPEDGERKETIKNAKKTLEISMTKESNKIKNKALLHGSA